MLALQPINNTHGYNIISEIQHTKGSYDQHSRLIHIHRNSLHLAGLSLLLNYCDTHGTVLPGFASKSGSGKSAHTTTSTSSSSLWWAMPFSEFSSKWSLSDHTPLLRITNFPTDPLTKCPSNSLANPQMPCDPSLSRSFYSFLFPKLYFSYTSLTSPTTSRAHLLHCWSFFDYFLKFCPLLSSLSPSSS